MMDNESFYREIIDNLSEGVYFVDPERKITYWNHGAEEISGYSGMDMIGKYCYQNILKHMTAEGELLCLKGCPLAASLEDGKTREADVYLDHADGEKVPVKVRVSPMRDSAGIIIGAVETFSKQTDVLNLRKQVSELRRVTKMDPLTGISNRQYLEGRLNSIQAEYSNRDLEIGILFLDVDHFKQVNDTFGHDVGDKVLRMVGSILNNNVRKTDVVGRWGGEEFLVILYDLPSLIELKVFADKICKQIEGSRIMVDNKRLKVTISGGGTMFQPSDTAEGILQRADQLMYVSKRNGRNKMSLQ